MASVSLVHGAWGGGWLWDLLRAELESRGHVVHAPDLPCEDVGAGVAEYAAAVPAADIVVGYSLGGMTIPFVEAETHVFLTALIAGTGSEGAFVSGFGDARARDELGRSYYPDPADAARELQIPPEYAHLAPKLRRQAPYNATPSASSGRSTSSARGTPSSALSGSGISPGTSSASSRSSSTRATPDAECPGSSRICSTRSSRRRGAALRSGGASRDRSAGAARSRPVAPPAAAS